MDKKLLEKYSQVYVPGSYQAQFPAILQSRRQGHLDELKKSKGLCLFWGLDIEPGHENLWLMNGMRIFQEPSILWLTGINQTGIRLVLDPKSPRANSREVLFVPPKDLTKEFWDGAQFGLPPIEDEGYESSLQEIQMLTGIQDIRLSSSFNDYVIERLASDKNLQAFAFYHDYRKVPEGFDQDSLDKHYTRPGQKFNLKELQKRLVIKTDRNYSQVQLLAKAFKKAKLPQVIKPWAWEHYLLRLPLEKGQVKDAKKAQTITRLAFEKILAELGNFKNENELGRALEYHMLKSSTSGLAFPSIIASGKNATVLHYLKNDEKLKNGSMVLMDFGVRYGTQHSDISRTIPKNGKYNPLQKLLYDIVLDAQMYHQSQVRPGVTLNDITWNTWRFLEDQLKLRFFDLGGQASRQYDRGGLWVDSSNVDTQSIIKPHGVSHLMGEQEHDGDPCRMYPNMPLQPGWMISNEPGLYGEFKIKLGKKSYSESIGIRIEDDLIVTAKGCVNLSKDFPHTTEEIEKLIGVSNG